MTPLEKACQARGIRLVGYQYGNKTHDSLPTDDWRRQCNPWRITLGIKGTRRTMTVDYWTGSAITTDPTAADVLYCLLSDADAEQYDGRSNFLLGFQEWCENLGYDTDSIKARKIYNECLTIARKLHRFLGDAFDEMAGLEH